MTNGCAKSWAWLLNIGVSGGKKSHPWPQPQAVTLGRIRIVATLITTSCFTRPPSITNNFDGQPLAMNQTPPSSLIMWHSNGRGAWARDLEIISLPDMFYHFRHERTVAALHQQWLRMPIVSRRSHPNRASQGRAIRLGSHIRLRGPHPQLPCSLLSLLRVETISLWRSGRQLTRWGAWPNGQANTLAQVRAKLRCRR